MGTCVHLKINLFKELTFFLFFLFFVLFQFLCKELTLSVLFLEGL